MMIHNIQLRPRRCKVWVILLILFVMMQYGQTPTCLVQVSFSFGGSRVGKTHVGEGVKTYGFSQLCC